MVWNVLFVVMMYVGVMLMWYAVFILYMREEYEQRDAHIYIAEHIHSAPCRPPCGAAHVFDSSCTGRFHLICFYNARCVITSTLMSS